MGSVVGRTIVLFFLSELVLSIAKRARRSGGATPVDGGTRAVLVVAITASIMLGVMVSQYPPTMLPWPATAIEVVALVLLVAGLALRWWAVFTLGRFFTVDVAIHADHVLVDKGPYGYVRHPSYTGLLLAFAGLGVSLGNALSVAALTLPIIASIVHRMRVEEAALRSALRDEYVTYCARTRRLVPGLY